MIDDLPFMPWSAAGCTGCGSQATVQLHPRHGRLCPDHAVLPTVPDGPFRPDLADDMVQLGRADAAFRYLSAYLSAECDRRFGAAIGGTA